MVVRWRNLIVDKRMFTACTVAVISLAFSAFPSLNAGAARNIGALYLLKGNSLVYLTKAEQWLERSISQVPATRTHWLLGIVQWRMGNIGSAVSGWRTHHLVKEAIEITLQQIERDSVERPKWERQIAMLPLSSEDWVRLGDGYSKLGEYTRSAATYQIALVQIRRDLRASRSDVHYKLGHLYQFYLADPEKALVAYRNASINADFKNPWNHADTYIQIAALLLGHDSEGALQAAQRAVDIMPENVLAHTVLGLAIFDARGDLVVAEKEMSTAAELDPSSIWPWMHRGQLYFQAQKYELAVDAYRHALVLSPDLTLARDMIAFINTNYLIEQTGND